MCGIVGYIGPRAATPLVMEGLRQLEYRGYDSAGLAVLDDQGNLLVRREEGKLANLEALLAASPVSGHVAIGHTRWATHGRPSQRNAHPHSSPDGELVVVHNGIVENYAELRRQLQAGGYRFASDTDTEVIAHLIHRHYHNGNSGHLDAAIRQTLQELRGPSAVVVLCKSRPDCLFVGRLGNAGGVAIGHGQGEMFVASDLPAIVRHTRDVTFLEDRQMAMIAAAGAQFTDLEGHAIQPTPVAVGWDPVSVEKGPYRHFMQKEIAEQGRSLTDTLRGRLDLDQHRVLLDSLNLRRRASPQAVQGDHRGLWHQLLCRPGRQAHDRRVGPSCRWRWTTAASFAIAGPSCRPTKWCWPSPRAERRQTRWPRLRRPGLTGAS